MKKFIIILTVLIFVIAASFCIYEAMFYNAWPVLQELPRYKEREIYSVNNFTDSTDYAKFTYKKVSEEDLKNAESFKKTTEDDIEKILYNINEYESFINNVGGLDEVKESYDFDKSVVAPGDYYYIESGDGFYQDENGNVSDFGFVTLYYFDLESKTLYYFHSDI